MLVDSHCHLDFKDFEQDFSDVLERAKEHDVKIMQTICTRISKFNQIKAISDKYSNIYCSIGNHPNEVENEDLATAQQIIELSQNSKVIGIGETGLDYYYENSPRELQKKSFIEHIKASQETNLPIIIHTRDADDDTVKILKEEYSRKKFPGLIHCFTAGKNLAEEVLDMGFYISISGIITFKNAEDLRNIAKDIPLERLLVETDAPYLAPVPKRGKRNEPAFTKYTAEFLAELKGVNYEEVAKVTTDNFFKLFSKAAQN